MARHSLLLPIPASPEMKSAWGNPSSAQASHAGFEVAAIGAEGQVENLGGRLLRGSRFEIGAIHSAIQLVLPGGPLHDGRTHLDQPSQSGDPLGLRRVDADSLHHESGA